MHTIKVPMKDLKTSMELHNLILKIHNNIIKT